MGNINFDGEWEFWKYVSPGRVDIPQKELFITTRKKGIPLDFTIADFELLIVNDKVKDLISEEEVQFIPVKLEAQPDVKLNYSLMVINNEIECVDENKSVFMKWEKDDLVRPDLAGEYEFFEKLVLDPDNIPQQAHIFRLKNYHISIVISEKLKLLFEESNVSGIKYQKLT
ncbi:hypothetical protein DYU05_01440 [Mucilaginibacter terrenus]|uniref:Immunity MXAN-0049 protein domain-containing protein n=1 Tax=Mucilaginibacter terrenus TaxID=2482727 RepID=A0A3E2NTN9_9SPHI|nr:DUF1629 domain-containing protein [Mucilaginibacter terrenus]RFZ84317.1 hypothetical protein DYU05_01440 [Mucilaginibacter terrenus]